MFSKPQLPALNEKQASIFKFIVALATIVIALSASVAILYRVLQKSDRLHFSYHRKKADPNEGDDISFNEEDPFVDASTKES